jgi:hypothetical protein
MNSPVMTPRPAALIALAGWAVPGLGYVLIGQRARGLVVGVTIILTFIYGVLIGGIRVVDVPGYRPPNAIEGREATGSWQFTDNPSAEIINKPWYIAQVLAGPLNIVASVASVASAERGVHASTARTFDIGTLYTAVAGMLNLLVIMDSVYLSTRPVSRAGSDASGRSTAGLT